MNTNPRYIKVTSVSDRTYANLLISLLEGCGFHVKSSSDDAGGINNAMTASTGVDLYVLEDEAEDAIAVLKDSESKV